jgi:hypothetical protein
MNTSMTCDTRRHLLCALAATASLVVVYFKRTLGSARSRLS